MAFEIKRICCLEIPGVSFLCFENILHEKIILVHAHPFIGLCIGKSDRRTCAKAFHAFLDSDSGQGLKNGGDLRTAAQNGQLSEHIYTHRMRADGGGGAALFVTLEGVRQILQGFPYQEESTRLKHQYLFSNDLDLCDLDGRQLAVVRQEDMMMQVCANDDDIGVYVLKFEDNCNPLYYVGKSKSIKQRLVQHTNGQGAACVSGRVFNRVPSIVSRGSRSDMESWERGEVLELMFRYGINTVRGWKYTLKTMPLEQKLSAFDDVCERFDLCRRCGRGDHFVRDCRSLTTDRWTNGLDVRTMYRMHMSSNERNEQIADANAKLDEECNARLAAEAKAEVELEARLAMECRNAEAIRLLMVRPTGAQ